MIGMEREQGQQQKRLVEGGPAYTPPHVFLKVLLDLKVVWVLSVKSPASNVLQRKQSNRHRRQQGPLRRRQASYF